MTTVDNETGEVQAATDVSLAVGLTRAEVDQQIATAKQWPRSTKVVIGRIMDLATLDEETAEECMYAVPRDGKTVEGPSARFAEIVAQSWGNCRIAARVVREEREYIVAQAVYHDLETNTAISTEVQRRVTKRNGSRYSADMIVTTGNAACSIARRNIILAGVPKAVWRKSYEAARKVVMGDVETLANRRANALKAFQKYGAEPKHIFAALDVEGEEDITLDHLVTLRGMIAALKNNEATVESMFSSGAKAISSDPTFNPLVTEPNKENANHSETPHQATRTGDEAIEPKNSNAGGGHEVTATAEAPDQTSSATNSNSSPVRSPAPLPETDKPASASDAADAGDNSESTVTVPATEDEGVQGDVSESTASPQPAESSLAPDWQDTYLTAMSRVQNKPKSLLNRHTEAIQLIGGKANDAEQSWMKAAFNLTKYRLENGGSVKITAAEVEAELNP